MARKLKTTPFARFLIAMLLIVPLAYFGASYINEEDPVQMVKEKLGMESSTATTTTADAPASGESDVYDLRDKVATLEKRIVELEMENARLKEQVRQLELQQQ